MVQLTIHSSRNCTLQQCWLVWKTLPGVSTNSHQTQSRTAFQLHGRKTDQALCLERPRWQRHHPNQFHFPAPGPRKLLVAKYLESLSSPSAGKPLLADLPLNYKKHFESWSTKFEDLTTGQHCVVGYSVLLVTHVLAYRAYILLTSM